MTIVISAVNIVNGGAMTVLQDCLSKLSASEMVHKYHVVALVHSKKLFPQFDNIEYIEFPKAKKHYIYRLYYEFFVFNKISKRLNVKLWFSLHDMSPRVKADIQAVYMHNPSPFYKPKLKDWKYIPINALWAYLYKYVYRINIHSNNYLVVQQEWLRNEFSKIFSIPKEKIIVSRPDNVSLEHINSRIEDNKKPVYTFLYPAYPRVFKNFDVICEAARILEARGEKGMVIYLTINGTENRYSNDLVNRYSKNSLLKFVGILSHDMIIKMYDRCDCLLFPSRLETWGLPISEFKQYKKPMIVSDLPYAHETAAGASKVIFFNPESAEDLANIMHNASHGIFDGFVSVPPIEIHSPCSFSWDELFFLLLNKHECL